MRHRQFITVFCLASFFFSFSIYGQKKERTEQFCHNATTIFTNASFITLNPKQPQASAIAVTKQRIVGIGDQSALLATCRGKDTEVIDLKKNFVVPGFIDTHSKFLLYGWLSNQAIDLSSTNVFQRQDWQQIKSIEQFLEAIKNKPVNADGWLIINGYDPLRIAGEPLNQNMLNNLNNTIPIIVIYSSGNQALLNQTAVQKIASLGGSKNIKINHNGFIHDKDFDALFWQLIDKEKASKALQDAANRYATQGYTTVTEAMVNPAWLSIYEQQATEPNFPIDIIFTPETIADKKRMDLIYQDHPRLHSGPVLLQLDGAAQESAAFFTLPYLTPMKRLNRNWPSTLKKNPRQLEALLTEAAKEKIPLAIECNGDAAIDLVLNAISKVRTNSSPSRSELIIINAPYIRSDQLHRIQQLGVKISWFAPHFYYWDQAMCKILTNPQGLYYNDSLPAAQNIVSTLSVQANSPSTPPAPLQIIKFLTTGEVQPWPSQVQRCFKPSNWQLSPSQALESLTIDAATLYGLEKDKGSLEIGKLADMTILNADPLQAKNLANIKVLGIITRGILHLTQNNQNPSPVKTKL